MPEEALNYRSWEGNSYIQWPNLFICWLVVFVNRVFWQERFDRFLLFLASLIRNGRTLRNCYWFSFRYKNVRYIGICYKQHFYKKMSWFPNMADVFRVLGQKSTLYLFLGIILASFILRRDKHHSGSVFSSFSQLYLANFVSFDSLRVSIHLWTRRSSYKTNSTSCCNT